jgi:hypothetical protein
MTKKRTTFITLLVLSGISFLVAILSFVQVSRRKLTNSSVTIGAVKEAYITERLVGGLKYKRPETVFCFRLYNSNQNFAIHLPDGGYGDLERNIRTGDSIKVYFSPSAERFNTDIYQVGTKRQVIYDFDTYKERATNKAGYMLIGGAVLLAIAFLAYTDFNIFKFLMRLTQV